MFHDQEGTYELYGDTYEYSNNQFRAQNEKPGPYPCENRFAYVMRPIKNKVWVSVG